MQSASRTAALEPQQEQGMHENGSGCGGISSGQHVYCLNL